MTKIHRINQRFAAKAVEKLTSGIRLNSNVDSLDRVMMPQVDELTTVVSNIQDGVSLAQAADVALASIWQSLKEMGRLASQSATGNLNGAERYHLDSEYRTHQAEILAVVQSTKWNDYRLLSELSPTTFHVPVSKAGKQEILIKIPALFADGIPVGFSDFDSCSDVRAVHVLNSINGWSVGGSSLFCNLTTNSPVMPSAASFDQGRNARVYEFPSQSDTKKTDQLVSNDFVEGYIQSSANSDLGKLSKPSSQELDELDLADLMQMYLNLRSKEHRQTNRKDASIQPTSDMHDSRSKDLIDSGGPMVTSASEHAYGAAKRGSKGPYIVSNSSMFVNPGQSVSFRWRLSGAPDDYEVYAYLLNIRDGSTIEIFEKTVKSSMGSKSWITESKFISRAGEYKIVFVLGSADDAEHSRPWPTLHIDKVRSPPIAIVGALYSTDILSIDAAGSALIQIDRDIRSVARCRRRVRASIEALVFAADDIAVGAANFA